MTLEAKLKDQNVYFTLKNNVIGDISNLECNSERACSLVGTRASVAFDVFGSTSYGSEYSRI